MKIVSNEILCNIATLLNYDPDTGNLTWKSNGEIATTNTSKGYNRVVYFMLDGSRQTYPANRIIWIKIYGNIPENQVIDHINNNPSDDRLENLRLASVSENLCNVPLSKRNKSGVKGIYFDKWTGKWKAKITKNRKCHYLGLYEDLEEAKTVIEKARKELHGEFSNHG